MSIEANRQTVLDFCRDNANRDTDRMQAHATPDATWWVSGRQDRFAFGGEHPYREVVDQAKAFTNGFESWEFNVTAVCAEGDRVMIEATSKGTGPGPIRFANTYAIHFTLTGGKISSVREYLDPLEFFAYVDSKA